MDFRKLIEAHERGRGLVRLSLAGAHAHDGRDDTRRPQTAREIFLELAARGISLSPSFPARSRARGPSCGWRITNLPRNPLRYPVL